MAKKDRTSTSEPTFRLHGVDLSNESPIREPKIGPTPDPTTPGTPITFTSDVIDKEDFSVTLLTSPTTLEESPDQPLARPIRGVGCGSTKRRHTVLTIKWGCCKRSCRSGNQRQRHWPKNTRNNWWRGRDYPTTATPWWTYSLPTPYHDPTSSRKTQSFMHQRHVHW